MFFRSTLVLSVFAASAVALWPIPRQLSTGTSALTLSSSFKISYTGSLAQNTPSDLKSAVSRTLGFLHNDKLERLVVGGASADAKALKSAKKLPSLTLALSGAGKVSSIASNAILAIEERDEAYELNIPADGSSATLSANSTLGLFRGLTTFSQLWYTSGSTVYTIEAPVKISDKPAYPYRGLMLDTSRNYFPVSDILRTLDGMSYVKINTFHWHIVDSQSFPLVVPNFPELSGKGAYSPDEVYTPADVKKIVTYAAERGVNVILEIDTPGHTSIISKSHPEYIACPEATPWASFANEPPAGQLRLASPSVLKFIQSLFSSVLADLPGKYFSTGGDEINANCYAKDAETQAELTKQGKTFEQALDTFIQTAHGAVRKAGKIPVVWEEMVLDYNLTIGKDSLVLVWISSANVQAVVEKGYKVVHAASDYFYLDCGHGAWVGDFASGNSWCDPFKSWQKAYTFNPLQNLTSAQASLVQGGQHLLWAEQSDPNNLDSIVWPRAASSAEIFWTGATLPSGQAANVQEALPRLHDVRYRLVKRGVKAIALQPHWCAIRPGACDLTA